jgi:hypothetical protein
MKVNPRKIDVQSAGKRRGSISHDGVQFVFEAAGATPLNGEAFLRKWAGIMRVELGVEASEPEALLRFIVLRTWGHLNGAFFAADDQGMEMTRQEYDQAARDLNKQIRARAAAVPVKPEASGSNRS